MVTILFVVDVQAMDMPATGKIMVNGKVFLNATIRS